MTNKLEKYTQERQKLLRKLQTMQERLKGMDDKIVEEENTAIRAVMKSEKLSLSELMRLIQASSTQTSEQKHTQVYEQRQVETQETTQDPHFEGGHD